jgi:hypothetical protein
MRPTRALATTIADREVRRLASFPDLLCDLEEFRSDYNRLLQQIRLQRQGELDASKKIAYGEILQEFAAEAGFLIGLEMGKRLGGVR